VRRWAVELQLDDVIDDFFGFLKAIEADQQLSPVGQPYGVARVGFNGFERISQRCFKLPDLAVADREIGERGDRAWIALARQRQRINGLIYFAR
jgi:hypothetical protein